MQRNAIGDAKLIGDATLGIQAGSGILSIIFKYVPRTHRVPPITIVQPRSNKIHRWFCQQALGN